MTFATPERFHRFQEFGETRFVRDAYSVIFGANAGEKYKAALGVKGTPIRQPMHGVSNMESQPQRCVRERTLQMTCHLAQGAFVNVPPTPHTDPAAVVWFGRG